MERFNFKNKTKTKVESKIALGFVYIRYPRKSIEYFNFDSLDKGARIHREQNEEKLIFL